MTRNDRVENKNLLDFKGMYNFMLNVKFPNDDNKGKIKGGIELL